ncbi:hypothetical protein D3C77_417320 [compost metagenome]
MQLAGYRIAVQPFELVGDRLLSGKLHIFINRRMQVIALLRSRQFRNSTGHVARVDRHAFIPVFAAQFVLILHLQTVEAHKFLRRILQPWILILRGHQFSDRIIPRHVQRRAEFPQIADRLNRYPVLVVMADALLHDIDTWKLIFPFQEISNLPISQIDLNSSRCEAACSPVFQIHGIDNILERHRRGIRVTIFIKSRFQLLCQSYGFRAILLPLCRALAVILLKRNIQGLYRRRIGQLLSPCCINRPPRRRKGNILHSKARPLLS